MVGGLNPLKNMKVSWDDEIPYIWKIMFTTNQLYIYINALICIHYWAQSCSAGLVRPRYVHGITQGPQGPMWATWPLATMDTHSHVQRAIKIP